MKSSKNFLSYQRAIVRVLTIKDYTFKELEQVCLCKIGHAADWNSYIHALEDLAHNNRIRKSQTGFTLLT